MIDHSQCDHPKTTHERKKCRDTHGVTPSPTPPRPPITTNPDDERHGTVRGRWAGCTNDCCRLAYNKYQRDRRRAYAYARWENAR